jgi:hypothetical protein
MPGVRCAKIFHRRAPSTAPPPGELVRARAITASRSHGKAITSAYRVRGSGVESLIRSPPTCGGRIVLACRYAHYRAGLY